MERKNEFSKETPSSHESKWKSLICQFFEEGHTFTDIKISEKLSNKNKDEPLKNICSKDKEEFVSNVGESIKFENVRQFFEWNSSKMHHNYFSPKRKDSSTNTIFSYFLEKKIYNVYPIQCMCCPKKSKTGIHLDLISKLRLQSFVKSVCEDRFNRQLFQPDELEDTICNCFNKKRKKISKRKKPKKDSSVVSIQIKVPKTNKKRKKLKKDFRNADKPSNDPCPNPDCPSQKICAEKASPGVVLLRIGDQIVTLSVGNNRINDKQANKKSSRKIKFERNEAPCSSDECDNNRADCDCIEEIRQIITEDLKEVVIEALKKSNYEVREENKQNKKSERRTEEKGDQELDNCHCERNQSTRGPHNQIPCSNFDSENENEEEFYCFMPNYERSSKVQSLCGKRKNINASACTVDSFYKHAKQCSFLERTKPCGCPMINKKNNETTIVNKSCQCKTKGNEIVDSQTQTGSEDDEEFDDEAVGNQEYEEESMMSVDLSQSDEVQNVSNAYLMRTSFKKNRSRKKSRSVKLKDVTCSCYSSDDEFDSSSESSEESSVESLSSLDEKCSCLDYDNFRKECDTQKFCGKSILKPPNTPRKSSCSVTIDDKESCAKRKEIKFDRNFIKCTCEDFEQLLEEIENYCKINTGHSNFSTRVLENINETENETVNQKVPSNSLLVENKEDNSKFSSLGPEINRISLNQKSKQIKNFERLSDHDLRTEKKAYLEYQRPYTAI